MSNKLTKKAIVHELTVTCSQSQFLLYTINATIEAINILGKKLIPHNLGIAFLCTLRLSGISYNPFCLQKFNVKGIKASPQAALARNAMIIKNAYISVIEVFFYITEKRTYYCILTLKKYFQF